MGDLLDSAPFKFAPPNGIAFFEALGWKLGELRSLFHEGARIKRLPLLMPPFARAGASARVQRLRGSGWVARG
jgi:hypothetical protein